MNQYKSGLSGEAQAEAYLLDQGMTTVTTRYRGADGEIDLIMREGDVLVFVEVKFRPSANKGAGLITVTPAKQQRILHAAQSFLFEMNEMDHLIRFDVVEITRDGLIHIPNAFGA